MRKDYIKTTVEVATDPYIGRKFICGSHYIHTVTGYSTTASGVIILHTESGNCFLSVADFIVKEVNETK